MNNPLPKKRDLAMLVDHQHTSFFKHRPSLLILGTSIIVTFLTFFMMQELEKSRLQNEFEHLSTSVFNTLKDSVNNNLDVLNELGGLYASSEFVDRAEFKQFSEHIFKRRPDIFMLGWAPQVMNDELDSFVKSVKDVEIPNYVVRQYDHRGVIVPLTERSEYFPVYYVEPAKDNQDMLGLDQASYEITKQAMRKSLETGLPASTIIMNLPQLENEPPASRSGFLAFAPIYQKNAELDSFSQRKENLLGYAVAAFHVQRMFESVLRNFKTDELELRIFAKSIRTRASLNEDRLIYTYNPQPSGDAEKKWRFKSEISVAGHHWKIVATSTKIFKKNRYRWESAAVFAIGVLLGFLLAIYIFSFERNRIREIMIALSLTDELTQLYNRRGLWLLADEQIRLSIRHKRGFWLFVMDMDELKRINDSLGHPEGDRAIKAVAQLLQHTFRKADIISRIGGDEFAVVALEAAHSSLPELLQHLQSELKQCNTSKERSYKLQLSVGSAYFDPASPCAIDELIARADKELYAQKNAHRSQNSKSDIAPH